MCTHLSIICAQLHIYIRCLPAILDHTVNPSGLGLEMFDAIGRFGHFMTVLGPSEQGTHYKCCQSSSSTFIRLCLFGYELVKTACSQ